MRKLSIAVCLALTICMGATIALNAQQMQPTPAGFTYESALAHQHDHIVTEDVELKWASPLLPDTLEVIGKNGAHRMLFYNNSGIVSIPGLPLEFVQSAEKGAYDRAAVTYDQTCGLITLVWPTHYVDGRATFPQPLPTPSPTYTISGYVKDMRAGKGLANVSVRLETSTGVSATTTNADGYYAFTDEPRGTYNIVPVMAGYSFEFAIMVPVNSDTVRDFAATKLPVAQPTPQPKPQPTPQPKPQPLLPPLRKLTAIEIRAWLAAIMNSI